MPVLGRKKSAISTAKYINTLKYISLDILESIRKVSLCSFHWNVAFLEMKRKVHRINLYSKWNGMLIRERLNLHNYSKKKIKKFRGLLAKKNLDCSILWPILQLFSAASIWHSRVHCTMSYFQLILNEAKLGVRTKFIQKFTAFEYSEVTYIFFGASKT